MSDSVLQQRDDGVLSLIINRPEHRNALNAEVLMALRAHLVEANSNSDIRCVVLRGAGDKAFCAGMDLEEMVSADADRSLLVSVLRAINSLNKPIVAAVKGYALAGGMGLAVACDVVIADESAVMGLPEINIGLWPFVISVPLLQSLAPKVVLDLMMTGRMIDAAEAFRVGAITKFVTIDEFDAQVSDYAAELASKPSQAMTAGRSSFYRLLNESNDDQFRELLESLESSLKSDDAKEGIAAFRERRAPNWR